MFGYLGYVKYTMQPNHEALIPNPEERELMEQARLETEVNGQTPFYYDALAGLGRQLTGWGELLQERYDREA